MVFGAEFRIMAASIVEGNDLILDLYDDDTLDDEDAMLLLDANRPRRNLHMEQPYWQYQPFDIVNRKLSNRAKTTEVENE